MLEKKLLTLACAVGILSCGACFGPPPHRAPAPPPIGTDLQGIRSVRVEATNLSEAPHLDPSDLSRAVAEAINAQRRETQVKAYALKEAGDGDAILQISVLSETATPGPQLIDGRGELWTFLVKTSAVLTKKDGTVLWTETNGSYQLPRGFTKEDPEVVWKDTLLRNWVTTVLSRRLVYQMLYVR